MSDYRMLDIAGQTQVKLSKGAIIAADATDVTGAIIDRTACKLPLTALAIADIAFTTGSGSGVATQTMLMTVQHGDDSALSDVATLSTYSVVHTWVANGLQQYTLALPVDLSAAKRYVRIKAKVTKAGTVTITLQYVGHLWVFGGERSVPASTYVSTGYEDDLQVIA